MKNQLFIAFFSTFLLPLCGTATGNNIDGAFWLRFEGIFRRDDAIGIPEVFENQICIAYSGNTAAFPISMVEENLKLYRQLTGVNYHGRVVTDFLECPRDSRAFLRITPNIYDAELLRTDISTTSEISNNPYPLMPDERLGDLFGRPNGFVITMVDGETHQVTYKFAAIGYVSDVNANYAVRIYQKYLINQELFHFLVGAIDREMLGEYKEGKLYSLAIEMPESALKLDITTGTVTDPDGDLEKNPKGLCEFDLVGIGILGFVKKNNLEWWEIRKSLTPIEEERIEQSVHDVNLSGEYLNVLGDC